MSPFIYEVPVRFHDIDFAGIVFFARIFYFAHDANEAWLCSLGCHLEVPVVKRGYALPFVHAEADYHEPIRGGQSIMVEVEPIAVGKTSYTLRSRLCAASGRCHATGRLPWRSSRPPPSPAVKSGDSLPSLSLPERLSQ